MSELKLTDGSKLIFEKDSKKDRFLMKIKTMIGDGEKTIILHIDKSVLNWINFETEDLIKK